MGAGIEQGIGNASRRAQVGANVSAIFVVVWTAFWLVVVGVALVTGSVGFSDLKDAIELVLGCLIWFGGTALAWRRYGWAGIKIRGSFRGLWLGVCIRKWLEAEEIEKRAAAVAQAARDAVAGAEGPSEEQLRRARVSAQQASEAAERVTFRRGLAGQAMKALHEAVPEDEQLARDLRDFFPELHAGAATRGGRR